MTDSVTRRAHCQAMPFLAVKGLGGLLAVPHVVFESAALPGYNLRFNYLMPAVQGFVCHGYLWGMY